MSYYVANWASLLLDKALLHNLYFYYVRLKRYDRLLSNDRDNPSE